MTEALHYRQYEGAVKIGGGATAAGRGDGVMEIASNG